MKPFGKRSEPAAEKQEHVERKSAPSEAADQKITLLACFLGLVASIGGFMFGYVR